MPPPLSSTVWPAPSAGTRAPRPESPHRPATRTRYAQHGRSQTPRSRRKSSLQCKQRRSVPQRTLAATLDQNETAPQSKPHPIETSLQGPWPDSPEEKSRCSLGTTPPHLNTISRPSKQNCASLKGHSARRNLNTSS